MAVGLGLLAAAVLAGCANPHASSRVYTFEQTQRAQTVVLGHVTGVRPIVIQASSTSGLGAAAGGVLGGVAGSAIGGGSGRRLTTVGGAIGGAMVGNAAENARSTRQGVEITLQLDNGGTRVVAQEADVPVFVGQRVQVITHGGVTRVAPL
ncbi:glycine zipper 2TM domain-containing protein [Bordetella sp. BOR01]|uniref:glycine zipper 2TM domain-containing protein n=1 Tax=Bordetella sp. BOR01 TaxID=2854779 RepID=UPI002105681D|nr:glycine zipper 2TM domain-containing protein [Bordetella sp. BOR01]